MLQKILILGGNRFFGKQLAQMLIAEGHQVTLLNRGHQSDGLGNAVDRLHCDRNNALALQQACANQKWDVVYDQVCFDSEHAQSAIEIFSRKTQRYIFTSSQSVYELGSNLEESSFDPMNFKFSQPVKTEQNYAEAKRQAEATFFRQSELPVCAARVSMVFGSDDYTGRFRFHTDRVRQGRPIYFPNLNARLSLISSQQVARVLLKLGLDCQFQGPANVTLPQPLQLAEFMQLVEEQVGKKAVYADAAIDENHSRYGVKSDWFMNVDKLCSLGIDLPLSREELLSVLKSI